MKKSLKFIVVVLALTLVLGVCQFGTLKNFAVAQNSQNTINLGSFYCANYENSDEQKTMFTPMDEDNNRLTGASWKPELLQNTQSGITSQKHIDDAQDITLATNGFAQVTNVNNLYVDVWVYFSTHNQLTLTLGFSNEDGGKVEWVISNNLLAELLAKDYTAEPETNYDMSFYTTNTVPYGWNLLRLPFAVATVTQPITIDGGSGTFLNLTQFYVSQAENIISAPLYIYSVNFYEAQQALSKISVAQKQAVVSVVLKKDLNTFTKGSFYKGEIFNLPTFSEVFSSVWIGEKNLLTAEYRNEQYFRIVVSDGSNVQNLYYGTGTGENAKFKMQASIYTITFCIGDPTISGSANNYFKTLGKPVELEVEDYGTGVWFTTASSKLEVGKELTLEYNIHKAFNGAQIEFSSSNEDVLKIVKIDEAKNTVTVKALKKGEATIVIKVYDDRLNAYGTSYEDGIVNEDLVIEVTKTEQKKVNITQILLWVCFSGIVAFGGYSVFKVIKNRNNYEVR